MAVFLPDEELSAWRKREDLRAMWEAFLQTDAFEAGARLLEAYNRPVICKGEPLQDLAVRQAYQAGYEAALYRLRRIHKLQDKGEKFTRTPEWGDLEEI